MSDRFASTSDSLYNNFGTEIPFYKINKSHFLNRSIVLYGQSETGKSTAGKHILYHIQHDIAWGLVIAPTACVNEGYDDCMDKLLIKKDITIEKLIRIMKRQEAATQIYKDANRVEVLASLFNMVCTSNDKIIEKRIISVADTIIERIYKDNRLSQSMKISQKKKIIKKKEEDLRNLYKLLIKKNYNTFKHKLSTLNEQQQFCIIYINFCPNILLVFDDFAARFKAFQKDKRFASIKEMFYNGRHYNITHIYMMQEEKELETEIRKNIFVSIFCNNISAFTFFSKQSSGLKSGQKDIESTIIKVFYEEKGTTNHNKLIYGRKLNPSFQYMVPDMYEDGAIYIGGKCVREYLEKIRIEKGKVSNSNNSYYNEFRTNMI